MIKASELLQFKAEVEFENYHRQELSIAIAISLDWLHVVFESTFKELIRRGYTNIFLQMDKDFKFIELSSYISSIDICVNPVKDREQVLDNIVDYFNKLGYKANIKEELNDYLIEVSIC